jgi:large subunit ribosomal protein L21
VENFKKYAIIKTGGKQYRVAVGDVIDVELLDSVEPEAQVKFQDVLYSHDGEKALIGSPNIADFFVYGKVIGLAKGKKISTLKYKRSHNQCRKWGHRQKYTRVEIVGLGNQHQHKEHNHGT